MGKNVLSDAECTMLTYALNQAQEKVWSEGGFTDEDQAAIDSLRRLADEGIFEGEDWMGKNYEAYIMAARVEADPKAQYQEDPPTPFWGDIQD